ncbi:hypothetical protein GPJ56_006706 [Histomonas meleagridis]|uniref:uncharacterized protein n=1 Tax=Histomonas meleagridis TaxID=135588 RepID=UPI003559D51B|nr:hypothetical protein GPJ56_006706 [Histomonas meleagridis]KAH0806451.1 hypothetical protein GO595_000613 [Histomonas meleagridis]
MQETLIKTVSGKTFSIKCSPEEPIHSLIEKVRNLLQSKGEIQLIYQQKILDENLTIKDIGYEPPNFFVVCPKSKPSPRPKEITISNRIQSIEIPQPQSLKPPIHVAILTQSSSDSSFDEEDYDDTQTSSSFVSQVDSFQNDFESNQSDLYEEDEEEEFESSLNCYDNFTDEQKQDIKEIQNETGLDFKKAVLIYVSCQCSKENAILSLREMSK